MFIIINYNIIMAAYNSSLEDNIKSNSHFMFDWFIANIELPSFSYELKLDILDCILHDSKPYIQH